MRTISLLGSTGSIGRQSLDVIAALPNVCGRSDGKPQCGTAGAAGPGSSGPDWQSALPPMPPQT